MDSSTTSTRSGHHLPVLMRQRPSRAQFAQFWGEFGKRLGESSLSQLFWTNFGRHWAIPGPTCRSPPVKMCVPSPRPGLFDAEEPMFVVPARCGFRISPKSEHNDVRQHILGDPPFPTHLVNMRRVLNQVGPEHVLNIFRSSRALLHGDHVCWNCSALNLVRMSACRAVRRREGHDALLPPRGAVGHRHGRLPLCRGGRARCGASSVAQPHEKSWLTTC